MSESVSGPNDRLAEEAVKTLLLAVVVMVWFIGSMVVVMGVGFGR